MTQNLYKVVDYAPAVAVALSLYVFVSTADASVSDRIFEHAVSEATLCGSAVSCPGSFADTAAHTWSRRPELRRSLDGHDGPPKIAVTEQQLISSPSPVPEPETYALLIVGLGVMSFIIRRRR